MLFVILSIEFIFILVELLLSILLSGLHGCLYVHHVKALPTHVLGLSIVEELVLTILTRLELEALLVTARVTLLRVLLTIQAHLDSRVTL